MLEKEKTSVNLLKNQIDNLKYKRLNELPIFVQREHEACATDITELHWHIAFHNNAQSRLKNKIDVEEKFCRQLEREIETIKKVIPLIEEKISLEQNSIRLIQDAQIKTDHILNLLVVNFLNYFCVHFFFFY